MVRTVTLKYKESKKKKIVTRICFLGNNVYGFVPRGDFVAFLSVPIRKQ